MEKQIFNWNKQRIDKWLCNNFNYSRNFFHHIIKRWWIKINWKTIKKSYIMKKWDEVIIDNLERYLDSEILSECIFFEWIKTIIDKKDYLVIYKPKWVLSHPNSIRDLSQKSVVCFLYHKYKKLPSIWNFIRSWIIHRLDKETDWLMIIIKTEEWLKYFKNLFQKKSLSKTIIQKENIELKKYYKAKCNITKEWKFFLDSIKNNLPFYIEWIVKAKVPHNIEKNWITKIISIWNESKNLVEIKIEILTWRTHQIRYHLSEKWLPIIWDYLYNKNFNEKDKLWLTAYKLEFLDNEWEKIKLEI